MNSSVLHIAVCDDEKYDQEQIIEMTKKILEADNICYEISMYKSSEELLAALEKDEQEYQFLLLDVVMDGLNGIELAARLRKKGNQVPIIFVSSYEDYALMGYEVEAVRYLAKPVREDKLREAIHYCKERFYRKKHILISTAEGIRRILLKRLAYVEISGRGTLLYVNEERIFSRNSITEIEQEVDPVEFCRCHQSFLVNLEHVEAIRRYELTLKGNRKVPVSKLRYDSTKKKLMCYVSS